jgi:hypothetical protein
VESALTISVTHVVASGFGSPKYLVRLFAVHLESNTHADLVVRSQRETTSHGSFMDIIGS